MGQDPNETDGKSSLSAVSPWPNLEKLCWAEQSADLVRMLNGGGANLRPGA